MKKGDKIIIGNRVREIYDISDLYYIYMTLEGPRLIRKEEANPPPVEPKMYLAHDIDGTCYLYYKEKPVFNKRFIVEDEDLVWISPIDPDDFDLKEGEYTEVKLVKV